MSSTAMNPPPPATASSMNQYSASMVNSLRFSAVVERLSLHLASETDPHHPLAVEYYNLMLSLARGIDYAVANNDVLEKLERIPPLVKEICRRKSDNCAQALVMVLLISVKNACLIGWFPEKERQEIVALIDDIGSCFYNPRDVNSGTSESLSAISTIIARFYPQMKMGQVLASLIIKPGYGAFGSDFNISKNTAHSPEEKIRLFVAQTDNMETSACIISPPQVNFLLNGKGVERRTNVFVDAGPQLPTNVTSMLKYGTNLLQAVGQFNGHYVVVIAFMSMMPAPNSSGLKDYVPPTASVTDSDNDIIEGPSRISLNCPISRSRIQVPVKGQSCKHLQCFDFSNFVGLNARRPSWRCPHCNQYVCFTDLCIDRNIAKVLKEVGGDITGVIFSADGSWKAMESDEDLDCARNKKSKVSKEASDGQGSTNPPTIGDVLDLTGGDDAMDAAIDVDDEDTKPLVGLNNVSMVTGEVQPGASNAGLDQEMAGVGAFEPTILSNVASPAINNSNFPVFSNGEVHSLGTTSPVVPVINPPLQQPQLVIPVPGNEHGVGNRHPVPVNVSRTPRAVQALPARSQTPISLQRTGSNLNPMILNSSSAASPSTIIPPAQQQFSRSIPTSSPAARSIPTSSPAAIHLSTIVQGLPFIAAQLPQQAASRPASPALQQRPVQQQAHPRTPSGRFTGFQNHHLQQALNHILPPARSQSSTTPRHAVPRPQTPLVQTSTASGTPQSRLHIPSQQANPPHRSHVTPQIGISRAHIRAPSPSEEPRVNNNNAGLQPSPTADGSGDSVSEQNWRPAGRMRGSLTGRPFTDEISPLVIQPTQATRPSGSLPPGTSSISAPPHLRALASNSRNPGPGNTQPNQ